MTIRVHRWHLLQVEAPEFPNIARYYRDIQQRPAFAAVADPQMHLIG
jgi:glutathione S-transferase